MKLSKELKTGLLAVFAISTFILGFNYLNGTNLFQSERVFYAVYDNVEGLSQSSGVMINGLRVGRVQEIKIDKETGNLIVEFNVDSDFEFSKNSVARIYGGGIIGGKSLAIVPDFQSTNIAQTGDTLKSETEEGIMELVNDRLSPLQMKIESAVEGVDSLMFSLNDVLDVKSRENLRKSIDDLNKITSSFAVSAESLQSIIAGNEDKLNRTFDNLDITTQNFAALSDSLAQLNLNQLVGELETTISNFKKLSEDISSGEGTIGKLLNDDTVYKNIEYATRQLEELLQDIKLNPKRYIHISVFGKKAGEYEEPESRDQ
ncbi:MlaD family protein [Planktosalinus lacus]|uniref:Organic solvent ABC transporter substrate-binding protein n=1 Tax=Planktosalinus lacus TaxID=1526573 RepID=A0A8J2V9P5_9FLAO|nr:MlaD family protein [Planktosalinus lacus]GGD93344.1 organic solvent ABC transporter substrate-binding protein [Planktosalinus lacus]